MMPKTLLLAVAVSVLLVSPAQAIWTVQHRLPKIQDEEEGMVRFTAIRTPPEEDALLDRSGHLTVSDGHQTLLKTTLTPTRNEAGDLVYEFLLRKELVEHSRLEVHEKRKDQRFIVGGGSIFTYTVRDPHRVVPPGPVGPITLPSGD